MKPITAKEKAKAEASLTEEEKRKATCCFTGHRPEGLRRSVDDIKVDLENEILASITAGYCTFITGMAAGVDLWAGCIVARLRDRFPDLKLIAAVPYPDFREMWDAAWQEKYDRILRTANHVEIIDREYKPGIYQLRNEWMVDHSSKVIAVYNWKASGTRNTINYAKRNGIPVQYIKA